MKAPLIALVLLAAGLPLLAAETPEEHLRAGDLYFARFDDARALGEYEEAVRLAPENIEALWKAAQTGLNVGDRVPHAAKDHETLRLRYYQTSEQYLRRAIRLDPNDSRTHFLMSATLGREVPSLGRKQQIEQAYLIKAEIDKALALDPDNDLAWHALAYWNRTLAEVGGAVRFLGSIFFGAIPKGTFDEAVNGFQKAIALNPLYCNHHLELARTYLDLKDKVKAIKELEAALACPDLTSMCPRFKERARRQLRNLTSPGEAAPLDPEDRHPGDGRAF